MSGAPAHAATPAPMSHVIDCPTCEGHGTVETCTCPAHFRLCAWGCEPALRECADCDGNGTRDGVCSECDDVDCDRQGVCATADWR